MRKIFRFGISSKSDAFLLVTVLESIFGLVYVILDGTDFFAAGIHLSSSNQEILIPPMIKWIASLAKFAAVFILWAHLIKSVQKLFLKLWIIIGTIHDLIGPGWIIVQDIRNKNIPDSTYPPLYRIVLLLTFRFYIYYFMWAFIREVDRPKYRKESVAQFDYIDSSDDEVHDLSFGGPPGYNGESSTADVVGGSSGKRKSVHFESISISDEGREYGSHHPHEIQQYQDQEAGAAVHIQNGMMEDDDDDADTVSADFQYMLEFLMVDYNVLKRLVKICFITEIVWNLYVLLIHEVRVGFTTSKIMSTTTRGDGSPSASSSWVHDSLFSINETVTLQMIWIRLSFIVMSIVGLLLLRVQKNKYLIIGLAISYVTLVIINLFYYIEMHNWKQLMKRQFYLVNLSLTVFFIVTKFILNCCVGYLILKLGSIKMNTRTEDIVQISDEEFYTPAAATAEATTSPVAAGGHHLASSSSVLPTNEGEGVELVFVINKQDEDSNSSQH